MADKLAKKGTDNRFQVSMKVTDRDLKNFLRERDKKNRSDAWALFQSTKAKFFLPNIESVDRFLKASPSVPLCQIVSGHTRLNDFVCEKLGLICSSMCKCKQAKETISHYFFECELYEDLRKEIWPDFQSNYAYLIKDWGLVNEFVLKSKRFSHSIRDALLGKEHK